jgi:hypothetical protein
VVESVKVICFTNYTEAPMKKTSTVLLLCLSCYFSNAQFADSLLRPKVWLRADKPGTSASTRWSDHSGSDHDAVFGATEAPVITTLFNFNKAYEFDGLNDQMKIPYNVEGLSEFTILSVFQTSDTTERGVWGIEKATSRDIYLTSRNATGPDSLEQGYGKNELLAVLNTTTQRWDDQVSPVSGEAFFVLGNSGATRNKKALRGRLAEFIVFNQSLDFADLLKLETYLSLKYGLSLTRGNYLSSAEEVLWHKEQNKNYRHRITAIGRDDAFALYQKQSVSAHDTRSLIVFSAGTKGTSNDSNQGRINDQDFLIFGDDNAALATQKGEGADSLLSYVERKWLMVASGKSPHNIATELRVKVSEFGPGSSKYWLVIDRSGKGNFSLDNLEYIFADSITSDSVAVFKNVRWDTDQSGKDNFGFVRESSLLAVFPQVVHPTCLDRKGGRLNISAIGGRFPYHFLITKQNSAMRIEHTGAAVYDLRSLNTGEYTVRLTDADKNVVERQLFLTMPDSLIVDLGPDLTLSSGEIVLDASKYIAQSTEVTYNWSNSFGFSSDARSVKVNESGIYKAEVIRKSDGCVFSDEVSISGSEIQRFAVFPTVVAEDAPYNISVSLPKPGNIVIKVYDLKGNLFQTIQGFSETEFHFISQIKTSGMYMVVLQTPNGIETQRLVVH